VDLGRASVLRLRLDDTVQHPGLIAEQSGGEDIQRRVQARALVNRPSLVLADEPTGNLDTERTDEVMQMLAALNREGQTFVLVTHDPDVAAACHRVIRMRDGMVHEETVEEPVPARVVEPEAISADLRQPVPALA